MITLQNICKTFRVSKREPGLLPAVRALFRREYSLVKALDNVSFTIGDGEMVGYIGPNGAGKSSTIKVMSGILTPDSGQCTVDDLVPWRDRREHVRRIGVVFGQRSQLWWDVPVGDSFQLLRDIYQVPQREYRQSLEELTDQLDLEDLLKTPARQLSLGQRMRCELAASLLHRPGILFLDEPTIGLDAASKQAVRAFIRRINRERGVTVLLTTHDMQDMEALASRILLIGKGRILLDGTLDSLRRRYHAGKIITVEYDGGRFQPLPGLELRAQQGGRASFTADPEQVSVSDAVRHLSGCYSLRDLTVESASVEDMVLHLYQEYAI